MFNKDLNPSRKTRNFKRGLEVTNKMILTPEFKAMLRMRMNNFIWGQSWQFRNQTIQRYEEIQKEFKLLEEETTEREMYNNPKLGTYGTNRKEDWIGFLKTKEEETRKNLKEFDLYKLNQYQKELETVQNPLVKEKLLDSIGYILSKRVVKLETLPKSYVTYLLDAITKSTIAQYTMEKIGIGYAYSMAVKAGKEIDMKSMYEFHDQHHIGIGWELALIYDLEIYRMRNAEEDFTQRTQEYHINLNDLLKLKDQILFNTIGNNDSEKIVKEAKTTIKKYWNTFVTIEERDRFYEPEIRTYNSFYEILHQIIKVLNRYNDIPLFGGKNTASKFLSITEYSMIMYNDIFEEMTHYTGMFSTIPELKKYDLTTKYSFDYHLFNLKMFEVNHTLQEAEKTVDQIEKTIKKLEAQNTQIDRVIRLEKEKVNLKTMIGSQRKHIDTVNGIIEDLKGRRWSGILHSEVLSLDRSLKVIIEKYGDNKFSRESLDWGATILNFDSHYKKSIEYKESLLELDKGYFWEMLPFGYSEKEASALGHCGNRGRDDKDFIFSLRRRYKDSKFSVHATVTVLRNIGVVIECKGKQNIRPILDYWPYLVELYIKSDIIKCAEAQLGHDPDNDFNINASQDASDNREKIKVLKPYLFSKLDYIYSFASGNLDNEKVVLSEKDLIKTYTSEYPSFMNWFLVDNEYEELDKLENPYIQRKKEEVKAHLVEELFKRGSISDVTFFNTENHYQVIATKRFEVPDLDSYSGRQFFDSVDSDTENKKIIPVSFFYNMNSLPEINVKDDYYINFIINFLYTFQGSGFHIYKFTTPEPNKLKREILDFNELIERIAFDNKSVTWMSDFVMNTHYELNYDVNEDMWDNNFFERYLENIEDLSDKDFINDVLMTTNEDGEMCDKNIDIMQDAFNYALKSVYESDVNEQIYSKFTEEVTQVFDYDPKTKKVKLNYDFIIKTLDEKFYDSDENNPTCIEAFTTLYENLRDSKSSKLPNSLRTKIEASKINTIKMPFELSNPEYSISLKVLFNIIDNTLNLSDIEDDFEPDVDFNDENVEAHFMELFLDQINENKENADLGDR